MNSWRLSSVMCPVRVRKSIAGEPLLLGQLDLGANACRWRTRLCDHRRGSARRPCVERATTLGERGRSRAGCSARRRHGRRPLHAAASRLAASVGVTGRGLSGGTAGRIGPTASSRSASAQPDVAQRGRRADPGAPGRTAPAARRRPPSAGADRGASVRRAGRVEGQHVRQHHRVGLRVRQVVRAAQHVADLVVQAGAGDRERRAGQVRAVERPRGRRGRRFADGRHAAGQRPDAFLRRSAS